MTDHSDKPPILRVLILLVALVGVALMLAALSPQAPEGSSVGADGTGGDTVAVKPAPSSRP